MMTVADIERIIEQWAPTWSAWERDNIGLQLGNRSRRVSKVLLALEINRQVVSEAIRRGVDLILTHHPPFFHPLSSLTASTELGKNLLTLAEKKIAVYSAHTNLDNARDGVSFTLAKALGLNDVQFLLPLTDRLAKIVVFVPPAYVDRVASEMSAAGAGTIGNYDDCSFRVKGVGAFRGNVKSNPSTGRRGTLERVEETRLEMLTPRARVDAVVEAMKRIHPYDEVAYDVYSVNTPSANFGMGACGTLDRNVTLESFLKNAKRVLHAGHLRYSGNPRQAVRTVAVCGGSGSDLLEHAIRVHADVFVTADVRYHTFHAAEGRIALVDAGHWETEHGVLESLGQKLMEAARQSNQKVSVRMTRFSTNPVRTI